MAYRKDEISIRNGDILEITKSKRLPVKNRLRCIKMNTTSEQQEKRNIKYATNLLRLLLLLLLAYHMSMCNINHFR